MKAKSTRATSRINMTPIIANLTALILEVERVKRPSAFVHVLHGSLASARDHATWERERSGGKAEVAP